MNNFPELEKRYGERCPEINKLDMDLIKVIENNIKQRKVMKLFKQKLGEIK